jgi:hypothetical protein
MKFLLLFFAAVLVIGFLTGLVMNFKARRRAKNQNQSPTARTDRS